MYTKTERKQLEAALKHVQKCAGDCQHCKKCHIYTASSPRALYMAVGCDALPEKHFSAIADTPRQLHKEAIEILKFELSLGG